MQPDVLTPDQSDDRIPCPDDMCTGILDEHGVCGTCGRVSDDAAARPVADGDSPESPKPADEPGPVAADTMAVTASTASEDTPCADEPGTDDLSDERVPCPDEMCVGVIGATGRCGTCGRNE